MADSTHHNLPEKNTDKNVIPVEPSATSVDERGTTPADSDQAECEGEKKDNGGKKNEAQQSVSMANYFVCSVSTMGKIVADAPPENSFLHE